MIREGNGALLSTEFFPDLDLNLKIDPLFFQINDNDIKCGLIQTLSSYYKYCNINPKIETGWTSLLTDENLSVLKCLNHNLPFFLKEILNQHETMENERALFGLCLKELLKLTQRNLESKDEDIQSATIKLICSLGSIAQDEKTLLDCIRMTNYFLISNLSLVNREASLMISEMCNQNNVSPIQIFNWNQRVVLKLVICLCATNYYSYKSTILASLNIVSTTFLFQ